MRRCWPVVDFATAALKTSCASRKALRDLGISLMQGYLFSKPLFETCSHAESLAWPSGL